MKTILEADGLLIRELTAGDLDFVAEMLAHPEVMAFWPNTYDREEAANWIRLMQKRYARDGYGYWLLVDTALDHPVGQVGLLRQEIAGKAETGLGYILHRPWWGRGYAVRSGALVCAYAFAGLKRSRLVCTIRPGNAASRRVAERLGFEAGATIDYAGFPHIVYARSRERTPGHR